MGLGELHLASSSSNVREVIKDALKVYSRNLVSAAMQRVKEEVVEMLVQHLSAVHDQVREIHYYIEDIERLRNCVPNLRELAPCLQLPHPTKMLLEASVPEKLPLNSPHLNLPFWAGVKLLLFFCRAIVMSCECSCIVCLFVCFVG